MRLTVVISTILLALLDGRALAAEPTGEWLVAEGVAHIRIENCDDALWGVVSWEKRPGGHDTENPDPRKRSRPTLGMPVLLAMKQTRPNLWEGEVYNPQNGRTYRASISLLDADTLRIEGCVFGFLCGGENWTRVDPAQPQPNADGAGAPGNSMPAPPKARNDIDVCSSILGLPGRAHQDGLK